MRYLFLLLFLFLSANSKAQEAWTLQDLINYAIKNSPSLIQAGMDVEIATLDEDIATQNHRYGFTSTLAVSSGFAFGSRNIVSQGIVIAQDLGAANFIQPFFSLQFDYPLFREGKFIFQRSISEGIARINYEQSGKSYLAQKQELIFSIADLFLQIVLKKKELKYMNLNMARLKTIVEENRERFKNKLITEADFLESELQLTDAQTNIKLAEMDSDILKKQLSNSIGMPLNQEPPEIEENVSVFENINSLIPDLDTLRSWALEQNPDLSMASLDVEESKLNLKLTGSQIYPTLSSTAISAVNLELFNSHFIGMSVQFPLDELFRRLIKSPEILKMKLTVEKSKINLQAVHNSVELELMQAYTDWKKARESALGAWNKVKVTEARVKEGENRFRNSLVTIGEYMAYLNSYEEAYNEFEEKKKEEYIILLTLLKSAGVIERFLVP